MKLTFGGETKSSSLFAFLQDEFLQLQSSHLVVVRAVGGFFHRRVLLVISDLHTHHRVHVEANQLPGLNHRYADLNGRQDPIGYVGYSWLPVFRWRWNNHKTMQ